MRKRWIVGLLCLILLGSQTLVGCNKSQGETEKQTASAETVQAEKTGDKANDQETEKTQEQSDDISEKAKERIADEETYPSFVFLEVAESWEEAGGKRYVSGLADLDLDGQEESLDFTSDSLSEVDEEWTVMPGQFYINGDPVDLSALCQPLDSEGYEMDIETLFWSIDVIDLDPADDLRELVVFKYSNAGGVPYYTAELLHYKQGKLISRGEVYTGQMDTFGPTEYHEGAGFDRQNRTVTFDSEGYALCCFYFPQTYQLKKNKIERITPEEMSMYIFGDKGEQMPITVSVIGSAKVYQSPTWDKVIYELKPGDEVTFLSTDQDSWVKIKTDQGKTGYLKNIWQESSEGAPYGQYIFDDDPDKDPMEVFQDLPLWG